MRRTSRAEERTYMTPCPSEGRSVKVEAPRGRMGVGSTRASRSRRCRPPCEEGEEEEEEEEEGEGRGGGRGQQ